MTTFCLRQARPNWPPAPPRPTPTRSAPYRTDPRRSGQPPTLARAPPRPRPNIVQARRRPIVDVAAIGIDQHAARQPDRGGVEVRHAVGRQKRACAPRAHHPTDPDTRDGSSSTPQFATAPRPVVCDGRGPPGVADHASRPRVCAHDDPDPNRQQPTRCRKLRRRRRLGAVSSREVRASPTGPLRASSRACESHAARPTCAPRAHLFDEVERDHTVVRYPDCDVRRLSVQAVFGGRCVEDGHGGGGVGRDGA